MPSHIELLVYVIGYVLSLPFFWQGLPPEHRSQRLYAQITVGISALLWPILLPLHIVYLIRKQLGLLTKAERNRLK